MQTIKGVTRAPWAEGKDHWSATWYEPFRDQADIDLAVSWILGQGYIFLNTAGDIHVLPKILEAASNFQGKPTDAQMEKLVKERDAAPLFV